MTAPERFRNAGIVVFLVLALGIAGGEDYREAKRQAEGVRTMPVSRATNTKAPRRELSLSEPENSKCSSEPTTESRITP